MTEHLGRLPYWEIRFDTAGDADPELLEALLSALGGAGVTDLFVFAHGWNSDPETSRRMYRRFFGLLETLLDDAVPRDRVGVAGVIWPSMAWLDEPIPDFPSATAGGAAGQATAPSDRELVTALKAVFPDQEQQRRLDELAELLSVRPEDPAELATFQRLLGDLVAADPGGEPAEEDAGEAGLVDDDPATVFGRFFAAEETLTAGTASMDVGGAAGLSSGVQRLWQGARTALRQATYFVMKKRAGTVGQHGLGPLVGELQAAVPGIPVHLLGHSFGARLVSYALAGLPDAVASPVKSLVLLQGAFSHFAFAPALARPPAQRCSRGAGRSSRRAAGLLLLRVRLGRRDAVPAQLVQFPLRRLRPGRPDVPLGGDGPRRDAGGRRRPRRRPPGGQRLRVRAGPLPLAGAHSDIFHPELAWVAVSAAGLVGAATAAPAPGR